MPDTSNSIDLLKQTVLLDPDLQAQLFEIIAEDEFIDSLLKIASASGYVLARDDLRQILQKGRIDWIERNVS